MDIVEAIKLRKSIRGYKADPVPREILGEIIEIATHAPSALNTQPWEFTVVTGEILDRIKQANAEIFESGTVPNYEIPTEPHKGVYRQRQVELAIQLFELMGITREDKAKRSEWIKKGNQFYGAPAAIIISVDKSLTLASLFDVGAITQTIALVALNYGLGTCIQYQGTMYPAMLRKFAGIPESKRIVVTIAIGYPDWEFPANRVQSKREPYENITTWCSTKLPSAWLNEDLEIHVIFALAPG